MDELTALRITRDAFGPYRDGPSPAVAERVLDRTRSGARRRSGRRAAVRRPGRPARWLLPVAAAAAVGSLVVGIGLQFRDGTSVGRVAVPAAPERPASLDGRTVLRAAADRARSRALPPPDPAGFVYTRETGTSPKEVWLPVDGKRQGLVLGAGVQPYREDLPLCAGGAPSAEKWLKHCAGPGYLTDIPADRAGALAALQGTRQIWWWGFACSSGAGSSSCTSKVSDAGLLERSGSLLGYRMLPAASRAAVLETLGEIRGIRVSPELVTVAGRRGIGVVVESPSEAAALSGNPDGVEVTTLVLDPTTYDLIGLRVELRTAPVAAGGQVLSSPDPDTPSGTGYSVAERLFEPSSVVDQRGLRPDGSAVDGAAQGGAK